MDLHDVGATAKYLVADLLLPAKSSQVSVSGSVETKHRLVGLSAVRMTIAASGVENRTRCAWHEGWERCTLSSTS
ncbi:hypothetical protein [Nonomuraea sp. NPDC049480]|uniref:hypothetical protein n=1 Tax=Nonomuraea sp. NPDC049480 TaxID=3364353 RepID=UPI0037BD4ED1